MAPVGLGTLCSYRLQHMVRSCRHAMQNSFFNRRHQNGKSICFMCLFVRFVVLCAPNNSRKICKRLIGLRATVKSFCATCVKTVVNINIFYDDFTRPSHSQMHDSPAAPEDAVDLGRRGIIGCHWSACNSRLRPE